MNPIVLHARALSRALVLGTATALCYSLWMTGAPLASIFKRAGYQWRNLNFRLWARLTALIVGMRIRVRGTPPRAPFFMVCNHLSYMDIVALAAHVNCVFVAKSDVAGWPVLGLLSRSMGTLFINRNSRRDVMRVNAFIEKTLAEQKSLLLFPEATSSAGSEVLPFHSALLEPAVQGGYPVSYAAVSYQTPAGRPAADRSVCWWGEMEFLPHLYHLFQLPHFEATLVFGSHAIRADDRKLLAKSLQQAVQADFTSALRIEESCSANIH